MTEAEALELAKKVVDVFAGDLAEDGAVDEESIRQVVELGLEAALKEIPTSIKLRGLGEVPIPQSLIQAVAAGLRAGVEAIIDATRPDRLVINEPGEVSGVIRG
jgi:hypothetical protein